MKRYDMPQGVGGAEHPGGEWVLYSDHCEAMKRIAGAPVSPITKSEVLRVGVEVGLIDRVMDDGDYFTFADHEVMTPRLIKLIEAFRAGAPVAERIDAAAFIESKAEEYAREFGSNDMGSLSFGNEDMRIYHWHLIELADEIRALAAPPEQSQMGASASAQQAEPIYQFRRADGSWIDQAEHSYRYNQQHAADETRIVYAAPAPSASLAAHPDDVAVDMFAKAMKEKLALARAKGRGGWQTCNKYELSNMLREHVDKGDPRDVANFCMFLHALGHSIQIAPSASPECTCPSGNGSLRHPCPAHPASPWVSINPTATLADRLDQLPEINFSNYDQGDVEALQAWAIEAYTLLAATPAEKKCTRCEYIGHCDCEVTESK